MSETSTPIIPLAQPFRLTGNDIGVVIIHGYGGSIGDYRTIAEQLHEFGYTVLGVRLAGHGQDQPALRASTIKDCQQSVAAAVTDMRTTCRHIFLMGSSYGGVLSLDYAARDPDLAGMILVNTALSYSGAGVFQGIILRLLRLFTPDYPKRGLSEKSKQEAKTVGSASAWPISGILATSRFARHEVIPKLPTIHVPALIIHSQDDPIVGSENSEKLATLLGSTSKKIVTIPFGSHRPFRSRESVTFMAEKTREFIQSAIAKT